MFVSAGAMGVRSAAVLAVSCDRGAWSDDRRDWPQDCERLACEAAIAGLRQLIALDRAAGTAYADEG